MRRASWWALGVAESSCLEWAEALARRGLGCLGIDAPDHGSRGTFTSFFSVDDLPALRDRFREMTFDLLQVERAAITFDLDGDGLPDVAPRLRYFGNSMGASAVASARSTLPRRHAGGLTPPP